MIIRDRTRDVLPSAVVREPAPLPPTVVHDPAPLPPVIITRPQLP